MDLVDRVDRGDYTRFFPSKSFVYTSVKESQGITALEEAVFKLAVGIRLVTQTKTMQEC